MNTLPKQRREYVPPKVANGKMKASPASTYVPPAPRLVPQQVAALVPQQTPPTPGSKTQLRRAMKEAEAAFNRLCRKHDELIAGGQLQQAMLLRNGPMAVVTRRHNAAVAAWKVR